MSNEFAASPQNAQGYLSVLLNFGGKPRIDRLLPVGADLKIGAVMVSVVTVFIPVMGRHELDHLQSAFCAVDVRHLDIGLLVLIERCDVQE